MDYFTHRNEYEFYGLANTSKDFIKHIKKNNLINKAVVSKTAAKLGYIDALEFLLENDHVFPDDIGIMAVIHNKIDVMDFLLNNGFELENELLYAIDYGHLDMVEYLYDKTDINGSEAAIAASNGHVDILDFLYRRGFEWNGYEAEEAAANNNMEVIKYLNTVDYVFSGNEADLARSTRLKRYILDYVY